MEQGEIKLRFDAEQGSFSFWYFDHRLPVRPDRYSEIVKTTVAFAEAAHTTSGRELLGIADHYGELSAPTREHAPTLKAALACVDGGADIIEAGLAAYTTQSDDTTRSLHRLLERQHYRLAHWRVAISEINYRRFFDINDLAGIRVEDMRTFRLTHRKVAQMIADGALHGLRLDHIDGLYNPEQYCSRLQRLVGAARGTVNAGPFYTVVEKILAPNESMPKFSGVAGTTGYDVLNLISRVLIDNRGLSVLEEAWQTQAAPSRNFAQIVDEAKSRIIETTMASEFTVLCRLLARIAAGHWPSRDYTTDRLRAALELFILEFPVYRTYIAGNSISESDRSLITRAISKARERWYGSDIAIFDFLQDVLTLDLIAPGRAGYSASRVKRFVAKAAAVHRPGHRQGRGRHGVLSLSPPAGSQRGGKRSVAAGAHDRRLPQSDGDARPTDAACDDRNGDARHQARRRCAGPHCRAVRDRRRLVRLRSPIERAQCPVRLSGETAFAIARA